MSADAFAPPSWKRTRTREFSFSDVDFRSLVLLAREHAGIALSDSKRNLVYTRVSRRLRALGFTAFKQYRDAEAGAAFRIAGVGQRIDKGTDKGIDTGIDAGIDERVAPSGEEACLDVLTTMTRRRAGAAGQD
ncbi:MAG: hypothetical protein HC794_07845 [Nitrospiraceae bacterium]|nr:hypothetical protein [Nitrospiraceae bacterium]